MLFLSVGPSFRSLRYLHSGFLQTTLHEVALAGRTQTSQLGRSQARAYYYAGVGLNRFVEKTLLVRKRSAKLKASSH